MLISLSLFYFTGSINLSYQGLTGRLELNARFDGKADYEEGAKIFQELWDSSVVIVDKSNVDEWNNKVMSRIWYDHIYSPYLMFIRVLKEYFAIPTNENLLTPYDITDGKYSNLKYQTDAVQMALNALDKHNGAIVADVVGLGKSVIASTIARNMKLRTIVICPPHLYKQWEGYRDEFGFTAWEDIYDLVASQSGKQVFSSNCRLLKDREQLILSPIIIALLNWFFTK